MNFTMNTVSICQKSKIGLVLEVSNVARKLYAPLKNITIAWMDAKPVPVSVIPASKSLVFRC
ncbi:hypothetical protein B0I21_106220 [Sphingobacterium paludis]|uniref:Uncharacterized protein n=1 Tax=Sphingobacterium paludis TaxID=1476465 RepID=A0A4R7CWX9_9SPHI|nr:hypothetical protein B0I21_106220 [Sphingobacterium paludis]